MKCVIQSLTHTDLKTLQMCTMQRFSFGTDAAILLWKLNDSKEPEQVPMFQEDEDAQLNKESWSVVKTLRYTTKSTRALLLLCCLQRNHELCHG